MKLRVVLLCMIVALTEGFDIQAIGLAAPQLKAAFSISDSLMGWVLSASTIGLFFGSFIGGRYSDKYGRRPMLIFSLVTFAIFTLGAAFSGNVYEVLLARFLAGIGFGAAMPNLIALMSENAPADKKTIYVSAIFSMIAFGGGIASTAMAYSDVLSDWRNLFILGGVIPLLCAPLLWLWLPESNAFLTTRAELALSKEKTPGVMTLFESKHIVTTLLLCVCFFMTLLVVYLLMNWLPSLVKTLGFTAKQAAIGSIFFNLGGAIGGILSGMVIDRGFSRIGFIVMYAGTAAMAWLIATSAGSFEMVVLAELLFGVFALGAQYGLYGISPKFYRTEVRGTGIGTAIGIGRLGAVAGPIIMGMLMTSMQASGSDTGQAILILVPACIVGVIAMMALLGRKTV